MPWFKKEEEEKIPDDLKGLTPEQIVELVNKGKTLETELNTLKQQASDKDKQINDLNTNFTNTRTRLEQIENETRQRQAHQQQDPNEIPSVVEDEDEAFRRRQQPLEAVSLHAGALAAQMSAEQAIRDAKEDFIYRRYKKEVDEIMSKEPPARRIFPQTWLNAYTYVKGVHFNEVTDLMRKGDNTFFSETAGSTPPPTEQREEKLTERELEVAKSMKITPERYLAMKKKIQVDTDAFEAGQLTTR